MTLGIAFRGTEGIVLAADSRVTITAEKDLGGGQKAHIPATFDNAVRRIVSSFDQPVVGFGSSRAL
jgi:hypothetical protein